MEGRVALASACVSASVVVGGVFLLWAKKQEAERKQMEATQMCIDIISPEFLATTMKMLKTAIGGEQAEELNKLEVRVQVLELAVKHINADQQ